MFKVKWDIENNGVILSDYIEEKDALNATRPVYVLSLIHIYEGAGRMRFIGKD